MSTLRVVWFLLCFPLVCGGCDDKPKSGQGDGDPKAVGQVHGLTPAQSGQVLAKVGNRTITVGEFADRLASESRYLRARYSSPESKRRYLDNLIRFELLAQEAERRGLFEDPEVQRVRRQAMIQQMLKERLHDTIQPSDISEEDIRAYYEAHRAEFRKPAQVRVSHILVSERKTARELLKEARNTEPEMTFFSEAASKYSRDEATRSRGGDLGFLSRSEDPSGREATVPTAVVEAAFRIEDIGGVYPELVRSAQGFHIIKLTGRRDALERSLEEAAAPIRNRLWRERRERAVASLLSKLRKKIPVKEYLDRLPMVQVSLPNEPAQEGER